MEIFKDIKRFEDTYQISNLGRVFNKKTDLFLKPLYNKKGYMYVNLEYPKGKVKWYIHRLVGFYFVENPLNMPKINHKDGNIRNNKSDNLEWITVNKTKKQNTSNVHKGSRFTEQSILLLPSLVEAGFGLSELNELTGVSKQNINKIAIGKSWRQLNLFSEFKELKNKSNSKIFITENLYNKCIDFWGNTVLNKMITKGILSVQSIETE